MSTTDDPRELARWHDDLTRKLSEARHHEGHSLEQAQWEVQRAEVIALCRRYDTPAVNEGAHALARKIRRILGDVE